MAPIKFEEDMKERLDKRTIQPSAKSWNTLSQRLDNEEKKNNKKGFWWLGIAASIVGALLVSNFFLNNEITTNTNNIIVEQDTIIEGLKIEVQKQIISEPKQEVIVKTEDKPIKKSTKKVDNVVLKSTKHYANNTNAKFINKTKTVISPAAIKTTLIVEKTTIQNEPLVVIAENITDKKNTIESKKSITIDSEINTLLARATEDVAMQKHKNNSTPIDYNGLLMDVEDDLDQTFRDKMFIAVKKGYTTVIESVADRNN